MNRIKKNSSSNELTLVLEHLPRILSSDSFYEKFAGRLMLNKSNDLSVEAARLALKGKSPDRLNKFSRMTACVALTGCLARALNPVEGYGLKRVFKACEALVTDSPEMLSMVMELQPSDTIPDPICN
jgi:hypothetical protein